MRVFPDRLNGGDLLWVWPAPSPGPWPFTDEIREEGGENKPHSSVHLVLLPGVTRHTVWPGPLHSRCHAFFPWWTVLSNWAKVHLSFLQLSFLGRQWEKSLTCIATTFGQKSNALKKKNTKFATLAILWVSWLHYTYWKEGMEWRYLHLLMHLINSREDVGSASLSPRGEWLHSDSQPAPMQGTADCWLEGDRGGKESPHYPSKITIFPLHHLAGRRLFVCFCTKAKYDRQKPLGYAKGYYISEPPMHF